MNQRRQTPVRAPQPQQQARKGNDISVPNSPGLEDAHRAVEIGRVMVESGFFANVKSAAQAAVKIMYGQELGLEPMAAMQGIHVIPARGSNDVPKIMLSGDIQAQLMKQAGYSWTFVELSDEACELEISKDGAILRDPEGNPARVRFTIDIAKKAGLTDRQYTPWTSGYVQDMLWNRAIVRARRRFAPEVTGAFRSKVRVVEPEDLANEPLDNHTRGRMYAVVREKGVTMEQKLEITNQVKPGCASWSDDGGLTNAEGQKIIELMEALPRAQEPDLFPALEESVKQTAKDVQGSPGAAGQQTTTPPRFPSESPADVDPPAPEKSRTGAEPGSGAGGVPTSEAHKGEVMASDEQLERVDALAAALDATPPRADQLTAEGADNIIRAWTKEYDKREAKK